MNKTVLVTGAGGYIGIPMCAALEAAGYKVLAFDRFFFSDPVAQQQGSKTLYVRGDTRYIERSLLEQVDAVVDLAGLSNDPAALLSSRLSESVNFTGACHLARVARQAGIGRYVYMSSASVYGRIGDSAADETSPCNPQSLYAQLKWKVEQELLELTTERFQPVMLRNSTVFGQAPRMRYDLAINSMTLDAVRHGVVNIDGDGRQRRPFIHVRDVANAVLAVLELDLQVIPERIFNLGCESLNHNISGIADMIVRCLPDIRMQYRPGSADSRDYHLDFSLAKRVLGFTPAFNIVDGITELSSHLINNPDAGTDPRSYTANWYQSLMEWDQRLSAVRLHGQLL
jgi:nucleoside-diphosphate-sugar epimerase